MRGVLIMFASVFVLYSLRKCHTFQLCVLGSFYHLLGLAENGDIGGYFAAAYVIKYVIISYNASKYN